MYVCLHGATRLPKASAKIRIWSCHQRLSSQPNFGLNRTKQTETLHPNLLTDTLHPNLPTFVKDPLVLALPCLPGVLIIKITLVRVFTKVTTDFLIILVTKLEFSHI